jgi:hypothetical protein
MEVAVITKEDLSLVGDNSLNEKQLDIILSKTPKRFIKKRPAKGGGEWDYVSGSYVKRCLNIMFGWDWDFEILEDKIIHGEVVVKGRLTCRTNGRQIVKMQYGRKEIVYKKETKDPLSIGNDMKAAATDALKKCAAEIGIASDIYGKDEFEEHVIVEEYDWSIAEKLLEQKKSKLDPNNISQFKNVIDKKDVKSYNTIIKYLQKI